MSDQIGMSDKSKRIDNHVKKIMSEYNIKNIHEIEIVFSDNKIWIEKDRKLLGNKIKF